MISWQSHSVKADPSRAQLYYCATAERINIFINFSNRLAIINIGLPIYFIFKIDYNSLLEAVYQVVEAEELFLAV